jgi:small subunit ribosomal protein S20
LPDFGIETGLPLKYTGQESIDSRQLNPYIKRLFDTLLHAKPTQIQPQTKEFFSVANHKSALKRARQNVVRQLRNRSVKSRVKTEVKAVRAALKTDPAKVADTLKNAQSVIDKAAKKGVIHKRTAARKISRLTKQIRKQQS